VQQGDGGAKRKREAEVSNGIPSSGTLNGDEKAKKVKSSEEPPRIGIIGALPEEVGELEKQLTNATQRKHGLMDFTSGSLNGREVVIARSGVGVIYASSVVTTMIEHYHVTTVIFTGVAGGIKEGIKVGDIIVAKDLINYEMNCKSFFLAWDKDYRHKLGEYPFMNGLREFPCDSKLIQLAMEAPLGDSKTRRILGRVVTGSEFHSLSRKKELGPTWEEVGYPEAVEMEGVAVAQVAHAYKIPFLVLRAISDNLEGDASEDFSTFAKQVAELVIPLIVYIVAKL